MGRLIKRLSLGALLLIFLSTTIAFGQTEILVNGDFESWDDLNTPTGWTKVENIDKDSTGVHGGTYAAKHTGGTKDLGQYLTVTPGNSYTITLWCKVESGDNTDARLYGYWRSGGSNLGSAIESPYFSATDNSDWSTWSTTLEAPAGADTMYFEVRTYSNATAYWDDLSVIETVPAIRTYYIGAAGTAPEGADPDYATIKDAFDALMVAGVDADITYYITSDITEPANLYLAVNTNDYSVTLKPYTGVSPTVTYTQTADNAGSSGRFIIGRGNESGADHVPTSNVTIDGSNTVDGTTRDLAFVSENGTYDYYFRVRGDCDNITIKNCSMTGISTSRAIVINPVAATAPDDLTIENCYIYTQNSSLGTGVHIAGESQTVSMENTVIKDNDIVTRQRGVFMSGKTKDALIEGNTFEMIDAPNGYLSAAIFGYSQDATGTTYVIGNNFKALQTTNTYGGAYGMRTIQASGGGDWVIANNVFGGFSIPAASTSAQELYGIRCGNHVEAYYNTFIMNDVEGTGALYKAINVAAGDPIIKNNIFVVEEADFAAHAINGTPAESDCNNFYLKTDSAEVNPTYATLADWQGAGMDPNSVSKAVEFVADDFHLAGASVGDFDLAGTPIAGITTDIDGDTRGTMFPYMGADEAATELTPPNNDLALTFDNDGDLANWTTIGSAATNRIWEADSTLLLSDGGYSFLVKRPVTAFVGGIYKLSLDVKTSLWEGEGNNCDVSVEGLGNDQVTTSVINDGAEWKTVTVIGIADAEDGYIKIEGNKAGTVDSVWVDNVIWDDLYLDVFPSEDLATLRSVAIGETVAGKAILTAITMGAPVFAQDATAGIALYDWDFINDGIVEEGDEILFIGTRAEYNGLQQVSYTDEDYAVLSKGNTIEPALITVSDLASRDYQCELVMIEDVDTVDGFSWPAEGSDASITLTDGTDNFTMRIDKDSEIDGATPPKSWPLDLIGVVGEFYSPQMMPRYMEDFITNQAPNSFTILNPADETVISSLDDPLLVDLPMGEGGDSVKTLFVNWTDADDPEGDSLTYEMLFIGDGPEDPIMSPDTFLYIPINEDKPYDMNGIYTYYFSATDPMGEVAYSDTHTITFDFPAPPMIVNADVVLVGGVPAYYAEFDLPLDEPAIANFSILDLTTPGVITPTAVDSVAPNAVVISAPLVEDTRVALACNGLTTPGLTISETDTTADQTVLIPFSDAHPEDVATIETFETGVGSFNQPYISGQSTVLNTSTFAVSSEEAYRGEKSGKLTLNDDPATTGGWYVREYHGLTKTVKANSVLMFVVKGTNANIEMRLSIKDTGYEQGPWKRISLSDDWQIVSFDLANDVAEGWINGNGLVEGTTVTFEGIHIRCSEDTDVILYVDELTERQVLSPVDITLNVIMKKQFADGAFNIATDYVDVAGTMDGWSGTMMTDFDGDTTWSVTIPMMPYSTQAFKFRINGDWDTSEFPGGGPNRELAIPAAAAAYTYWYDDDTLKTAIDGIPVEFALHQNYPNPFNPTTTINFDLPNAADVSLVIYDITGRKVRTLVNTTNISAGYKKIIWNGRDDFGNGVATGMYIYRLVAGDFVDVKKMTFLK